MQGGVRNGASAVLFSCHGAPQTVMDSRADFNISYSSNNLSLEWGHKFSSHNHDACNCTDKSFAHTHFRNSELFLDRNFGKAPVSWF